MSLRVRLACGLILITLGGTLFGATGGHAVPTLQKSTGTPLQPTQAKTKYNVLLIASDDLPNARLLW